MSTMLDDDWFTSTGLSSGTIDGDGFSGLPSFTSYDKLFRLQDVGTGSSVINITSMAATQDVYASLYKFCSSHVHAAREDVQTLKKVVAWQHNLIEYNSVYNAFLLEQITEDEFEVAATAYEFELVSCETVALKESIRNVLKVTEIDYQPSDMADLFRCDHQHVVEVYESLADDLPALKYMVPQNAIGDSR